jgi:hypothetical protein
VTHRVINYSTLIKKEKLLNTDLKKIRRKRMKITLSLRGNQTNIQYKASILALVGILMLKAVMRSHQRSTPETIASNGCIMAAWRITEMNYTVEIYKWNFKITFIT